VEVIHDTRSSHVSNNEQRVTEITTESTRDHELDVSGLSEKVDHDARAMAIRFTNKTNL
jgi:hypothetical protein